MRLAQKEIGRLQTTIRRANAATLAAKAATAAVKAEMKANKVPAQRATPKTIYTSSEANKRLVMLIRECERGVCQTSVNRRKVLKSYPEVV